MHYGLTEAFVDTLRKWVKMNGYELTIETSRGRESYECYIELTINYRTFFERTRIGRYYLSTVQNLEGYIQNCVNDMIKRMDKRTEGENNMYHLSTDRKSFIDYVKNDVTNTQRLYNNMFGGSWYRNNAIEKVIFNDPTTIVYWHDHTKTVVIYQNDKSFDREKGLAMAISAKSFGAEKIIFRNPDTIICWNDGSETMVSTQNDEPYDSEKGFYVAIAKKHFGNKGSFNNVFKKYLPKNEE